MPLSAEEFKQQWQEAGELTTDPVLDVAWRRYQYISEPHYKINPESDEPTLQQLRAAFVPLLEHPSMKTRILGYKFITLPANNLPWLATGVDCEEHYAISILPTGRTWRSRLLDLYLPPQFNLWYRIGVNGAIFNSTRDTKSFKSIPGQTGELYLANQFPGGFHDRSGGRVGGNLAVYDKAEGAFQILIIKWCEGLSIREDVKNAFEDLLALSHHLTHGEGSKYKSASNPYGLFTTVIERISSRYYSDRYPAGWVLLWFLGESEIFQQEETSVFNDLEAPRQPSDEGHGSSNSPALLSPSAPQVDFPGELQVVDSRPQIERMPTGNTVPMIRCVPDRNVGILQKNLTPPFPLTATTTTTWTWNITALPSRLREDTTISHDYLSLAFEFENGRDITYTWSWELPEQFGYWCPLAGWERREYHVVIRTGTQDLGKWLDEKRNLYDDYVQYINEGDKNKVVPSQITRVWLIAGNRWQRHRGEMLIKQIQLIAGGPDEDSIAIL